MPGLTSLCLLAAACLGFAPAQDRNLFFDTTDPGESKSIPIWGLDTAWLSETNVRRGVVFMGQPQVDVIRFSFTGDWPLESGDLGAAAQAEFDQRMAIVDTWTEVDTALYFNTDTGTLDASFDNGDGVIASSWAELIDVTRQKCVDAGRTVLSVSVFNEPDYSTWQGDVTRFAEVCDELRNTYATEFSGIRLMGGNTLSCDEAATWYNSLTSATDHLEEGNTHQLAGSFDNYAAFYQNVQTNNDFGCNDELHNVAEAMIGAEYGMDAAIWWGSAEYARGEFVKASDGDRLAYAEHRPNWTAASVYRAPDGSVKAFTGASERQAVTTTYRFISKDRDVYYDGHGPQRAFTIEQPGGDGYWVNQPNAEKVVSITWGEDVQPPINGRYFLVARHSGKVMEVAGAGTANGDNIQQNTHNGGTHQQWDVVPVDSRVGGDFSYFTITAAHDGKAADVYNWSLENGDSGGDIRQWDAAAGANQQWFLEYVEDGWFHIRSRWSGKYLDVGGVSTADGANIWQWDGPGGQNQQWRLIPAGSAVEFDAPAVPTGLVATANEVSVTLNWTANTEPDLAGYDILRATTTGGPYETIARGVATNTYTDGAANQAIPYFYEVRATDLSLNRSGTSAEMSAIPTGGEALVAQYGFEGDTGDSSGNVNHATVVGTQSYAAGRVDAQALVLDGTNHALLPPTVANSDDLTLATWVWWNGGSYWQRIFDFGNGTEAGLFLTPEAWAGTMLFNIRDGVTQTELQAPALATGQWVHVALTIGGGDVTLYIDGSSVTSATTTLKTSDIRPVMNYLGKSQWPDPLLDGSIDDFRVYNHALTSTEISALAKTGLTPPAPSDLVAIATGTDLSLSWSAVSGATGYNVKRSTVSGSGYTTIANNLATTSFDDPDLDYGTTYYYVVSASNEFGQGANSSQAAATTVPAPVGILQPPAAPTGLAATAYSGSAALSWNPAARATSYIIKRSTTGSGPYTRLLATSATSFTDFGLTDGTTYYYVVSAANAAGESEDSSEADVTPGTLITTLLSSNLEAGLGGWINAGGDTDDWTLDSGGTPTRNTGPSNGANNSAWYLYLETSSRDGGASNPGDSAILESPVIEGGNRTLTFHYHMYGSDIGTLNVDVFHGGSWNNAVWSISGQQHISSNQAYTQATVNLGAYTGPIQLRFRGVAAGGFRGDMAIDSIVVTGAATAPTAGPMTYLKFDETSGMTAADSTGNGWDGTLVNGPGWTAGHIDNALSLDGADDHLTLPSGLVSGLSDFTLCAWVRLDTLSTWARVFDFGTSTPPNATEGAYMFLAPSNGGGVPQFSLTTSGYDNEQQIFGTSAFPTGTWTHVAVTLSDTTATLYIDGSPVGSNSAMTLDPSSLGSTTLNYIGRSLYPDPYLDGMVDELRIYDRAFAPAEVASAAGAPPVAPTGVAAIPGDGRILLTWSEVAGATSYQVRRAPASGGPWTVVTDGITQSAFTEVGLTNGTPYYYVVRSSNGLFTSDPSAEVGAVPTAPPATPTGLTAVGGDGSATLDWGPASGAVAYNVRSSPDGIEFTLVATGVASTIFTDGTLSPGETRFYRVSSVSELDESPGFAAAGATAWTPHESWRFDHFGTVDNTGDAADAADPDGDGVPNLLERAFGGDPNALESGVLPSIDPDPPLLSLRFRRSLAATDLTFEVQESSSLSGDWGPALGSESVVSDDGTVETLRFTRPVTTEERLFLRVKVLGNP